MLILRTDLLLKAPAQGPESWLWEAIEAQLSPLGHCHVEVVQWGHEEAKGMSDGALQLKGLTNWQHRQEPSQHHNLLSCKWNNKLHKPTA